MDKCQERYNATLTNRNEVAPGLFILTVRPDEPLFPIKAGQYTVLGLCKDRKEGTSKILKRAYSICSSNPDQNTLDFYITAVKGGELSPDLHLLETDDRLWIGKKATGTFTLDSVPEDQGLILVATGTGLAPFICMMEEAFKPDQTRPFAIIHGVKHSYELGYREKLEANSKLYDHFIYIPTVTRATPEEEWEGHEGRVQSLFQDGTLEEEMRAPLNPEKQHVFLCGNPNMTPQMVELLEEKGFTLNKPHEPGTIHIEEYW